MRAQGVSLLLLLGLVVASCSQYASNSPTPLATGGSLSSVSGQGGGASPLAAVMQFGQADVGSPFPPVPGHDQSAHAKDNIVPRTVVIAVNGTVTFNVPPGVHQINIYKPGTQPEDVDTSMSNLTTLCSGHHAECHEGLLRIRGIAPDALVFELRRSGESEPHRVLTTVPQRALSLDEEQDVPRGTDDDSVPRGTRRHDRA